MLQMLDITKPVKEIILDKFNARAGLSIAYDHVVLGSVHALTDPASLENTSIQLVPTTLAPHLNAFTLMYNRMALVEIFSAPYLFIPSNGFTTLYTLLNDINLVVGLNLTTDDVDDAPIVIGTQTSVLIKAKDASVLYQGQVELVLDTQLNAPTAVVESSSTLFIVNKNNAGTDFLTAHSFDGFKSAAFVFLRNTDLISTCVIDKVFSCEGDVLVLTGSFQLVATQLPFISPAITYKTLTLHRDGTLVSAREEVFLLGLVSEQSSSVDVVNKVYYVADQNHLIGGNTKNVYRLFQNGTVDLGFNYALLSDGVVKLVVAQDGFYAISKSTNEYTVNKHLLDVSIDPAFSPVTIATKSSYSPFIVDGICTFDEFGQEVLHLYMPNGDYSVGSAPTITAPEVQVFLSGNTGDFFSPVLSIHAQGHVVKASGLLANLNSIIPFNNGNVNHTLVKTLHDNVVLYSKESFSLLRVAALTSLRFGQDKEFTAQMLPLDKIVDIVDILKIYQISSGYETYAVVNYIDPVTSLASSGVFSFDAEHQCNGLITKISSGNVRMTDMAVLR